MIYFVSDLHIDAGQGGFNQNRGKFHNFLDTVGTLPLILNGDTIEGWENTVKEIYNGPNLPVIKRLAEKKDKIIIRGNHDINPRLLRFFFPKSDIRLELDFKGYKVFHGFQVDPLLDDRRERWIVSTLDRIVTVINFPLLNEARSLIADWNRSNDTMIKELEGRGNFIVGHSHVPENLGWFLNTGSWKNPNPTYLTLSGGEYSIYHMGEP